MKIVTIVGARPQFIKAAPVSKAIEKYNSETGNPKLTEIIVHTGQHFDADMSDIFFRELDIPEPDYNLDVNNSSHGAMTGRMLVKIEEVLIREKPDWALTYGDTNSTLAGALAAVKLYIPVAHVEAGLRSFNRKMPEEHNRVLTDHCSDILFCPTRTAIENLNREGISGKDSSSAAGGNRPLVALVGDVMYDSVLHNMEIAEKYSDILKKLNLKPKGYALATVHRAENTDQPERLKSILQGFEEIAQEGLQVIIPVHPRTRQSLKNSKFSIKNSKLNFIKPVSYLDMLLLEKSAQVILTDSGGVQKEAYWFEVPCITLRDETEWVETVDAGWNVVVGADHKKIVDAAKFFKRPDHLSDLYGDGRAGEKIVEILVNDGCLGFSNHCKTRNNY